MTDRITGTKPTLAPAPGAAAAAKPAPVAASGLGQPVDRLGATAAVGRALSAVGARAAEPLALPPLDLPLGVASPLLGFFSRATALIGRGLDDAWDATRDFFMGHLPYGWGESLDVETYTYADARAKAWRNQPLVPEGPKDPASQHERGEMVNAARGVFAPGAQALKPESGRVQLTRRVAAELLAALPADTRAAVLHDPAQRDAWVARAVAIADRVMPRSQSTLLTDELKQPGAQSPFAGLGEAALGGLQKATDALAQAACAALVKRAVAIEHLPPDQRQRVSALHTRFADSPRVQDALESLVASGRLGDRDQRDAGTTLDHLETLATAPLAPDVEAVRGNMLGEIMLELAEPGAICQRGRNSCGAAAAQGYLAQTDPAEYVRVLVGLTSPAGEAVLADGTAIQRDPTWAEDEYLDDARPDRQGDLRTTPSRLLQSGLMDVSSTGEYDNHADRGKWKPGFEDWVGRKTGLLNGTWPPGEERVLQAITGKPFRWVTGEPMFEGLTRDRQVITLLNYNTDPADKYGQALHWVRLVGYDAEADVYTVLNAQRGTEDRVSGAEFRQRQVATVFPEARPPQQAD